jgi:hypothetical protein
MTTLRYLLAGILLGTMLGGAANAAERDSRGLAELLAKRLAARRQAPPQTHATDFAGTDIGCIILPRFELRPYGYPGHGFLCEVSGTGEVLGAVLNKKGRQLCDIVGFFIDDGDADLCYDFDICGVPETLCVI